MKRLWPLVLLFACDEPLGADDGVGNGTQTGCGVPSECEAEATRYSGCLQGACNAQYVSCYGPDYARGIYNGGPCSAYQACVEACNCSTTCQTACGQAPLTCIDCIHGPLQLCTLNAQCAPAQCVADAGLGNRGACTNLALCCNTLANEVQRLQCTTLHTSLSPAGDDVCAGVIPAFCP
jgi:hypothetical protein